MFGFLKNNQLIDESTFKPTLHTISLINNIIFL